ncbi:MAG: hypothetical protein ABJH98_19610 [Reichenbachiella sp.]|uniref:hypothetical protein n=1 Tax=Reichenbachiella sp. TaxID=2184521 RepID=UPI0032971BC4
MNTIRRIALSLLTMTLSSGLFAQSPWLNNTETDFFTFEFSKPNINGGNEGIGFFSAVYDLSGGFAISDKTEIIADLPISVFSPSGDNDIESEVTLGNIYLGVRTGDRSKPVRGEFGFLIPSTSDENFNASAIGIFGLINREEKFSPNTWGLTGKVLVENDLNDKGLFYRLKGGLFYLNNTDAEITGLYLDYLGQLGINTDEGLTASVGISGRTGLNDDSKYGEDDSSSFLFALSASYRSNNFEPGMSLHIPMDDPFKEIVNNIINVSLLFHLN